MLKKVAIREFIEEIYHIERWGDGHFGVNDEGNLCIKPNKENQKGTLDIQKVVDEIIDQGIELPVVIRFHDILRAQVVELNETFNRIIAESNYRGRYFGVYPIKVNQMREVVEEILDAGKKFNFGLEAGSKPELLSVLALNDNPGSLTVLNGYKDREFLKLALLGRKLGKNTIVVIEKYSELINLLEISKETDIRPVIGLRAKLSAQGSGKWSHSAGENAKFGLTISEILKAFNYLKDNGYLDCLKLLHYHVGSQVTNIQTIKDVVAEGARIYAELKKLGAPIEYMDVGGGLGVDYDGSQSTHDSSRNYSWEIYVNDVVYGIKEVCDLENVPHPNIVTESGRALTAHHSCIITEVVDKIDPRENQYTSVASEDQHIMVQNIRAILKDINEGDNHESFNDALSIKNASENAFKLGVLSLEEKAVIESCFWSICDALKPKIKDMDFVPEDLENYFSKLSSQYLCNLSIFQSLPDLWAIDQLLPILPISRLGEVPTEHCTLVDITCDSDGKIDRFINGGQQHAESLLLHPLIKGVPYYLGFFLTGAYQDVMGDMHNLFGRVNEVHVYADEDDKMGFFIETVVRGSSNRGVLSAMQYNPDHMAYTIRKEMEKKVNAKEMAPREGVALINYYENSLQGYTYLKR